MGKSNDSRRKELAKKFPEMDQRFQELKAEIGEPTHEHLGEIPKKKDENLN